MKHIPLIAVEAARPTIFYQTEESHTIIQNDTVN